MTIAANVRFSRISKDYHPENFAASVCSISLLNCVALYIMEWKSTALIYNVEDKMCRRPANQASNAEESCRLYTNKTSNLSRRKKLKNNEVLFVLRGNYCFKEPIPI